MTRTHGTATKISALVAAAFAVGAVFAPAAEAVPSCVAQSVQAEHSVYGPSWGRELISFLATHPAVLQQLGYTSLGDFVASIAHQDRAACPAE